MKMSTEFVRVELIDHHRCRRLLELLQNLLRTSATISIPMALDLTSSPQSLGDGSTRVKYDVRHVDTAGWLFMDGHVKSLKIGTVARTNSANEYPFFTSNID